MPNRIHSLFHMDTMPIHNKCLAAVMLATSRNSFPPLKQYKPSTYLNGV